MEAADGAKLRKRHRHFSCCGKTDSEKIAKLAGRISYRVQNHWVLVVDNAPREFPTMG